MSDKKYELIFAGKRAPLRSHQIYGHAKKIYQLKALRDIPEHGVKAGDLGGFVSQKSNLSHEGSCWVGEEARIYGKVEIFGDAYIGGKATLNVHPPSFISWTPGKLIVKDNVKITGNALIEFFRTEPNEPNFNMVIENSAQIFDNAIVYNVRKVKDKAKIYGSAILNETELISGSSEIFEQAKIGKYCLVTGKSKILGKAEIAESCIIQNSVIAGMTQMLEKQRAIDGKVNEVLVGATLESLREPVYKELPSISGAKFTPSLPEIQIPDASLKADNPYLHLFEEIQADIAAYETDIVKIIKYPIMTDRTDPHTVKMVTALKKAKRLSSNPDSREFEEAVENLEEKFLAAESNAVKMASTLLGEDGLKKTQKAKDLFRIASNEASTEQEKKVAFVQGFKQLEGVITVPEIAVDTFRVKIGLQELEALSLGED